MITKGKYLAGRRELVVDHRHDRKRAGSRSTRQQYAHATNAPRMPLPRWSIRPGSRMPRTVTRSGDYSGPPSAGGWTSCPGGELFSQFLSRRRLSTTIPMAKRANITTIAAVTLQW